MTQSENTVISFVQPSKGERPQNKHLIPWKKGQSGNPGGRPKGLAEYVRERTGNGRMIVDFMVNCLAGSLPEKEQATPLERIRAGEWLADRGFGKAVEVKLDVDAKSDNDLAKEIARQILGLEKEPKLIEQPSQDSPQ